MFSRFDTRFGRISAWLLVLAAALSAGRGFAATSIEWATYDPAAFQRAQHEDKVIMLVLEVPWSAPVAMAHEMLWNQPEVVQAVNSDFVAIRERADLRPDLARRYPSQGWPAVTFLLPNGSPLFFRESESGTPRRMATTAMAPERMALHLSEVSAYYKTEQSAVIQLAATQDRIIAETARPTAAPVGRATVATAATAFAETFDAEHRYFGGAPRIPRFELIEVMQVLSAEETDPWEVLAKTSLKTLLDKLGDPEGGGIYRMAVGLDWSRPQKEKLLDRNARMLDNLTLAWRLSGKRSDRDRALAQGRFLATAFSKEDGSLASALCVSCPGGRDDAVLSGSNGVAAAALIHAGAALEDESLIDRGLAAASFLARERHLPGRGLPRAVMNGQTILPLYLEDLQGAAWGFLAAYEITGEKAWLGRAEDLAKVALAKLRDADLGALRDTVPRPAGPIPLRHALYPQRENSRMVRVLVRLYHYTADAGYFDAAKTILEAFGASYRRVEIHAPAYVLASYEYFYPPTLVTVRGEGGDAEAAALRRAALGSEYPFTLVVSSTSAAGQPATVQAVHGGETLARPLADALGLRAALADLRIRYQARVNRHDGEEE